MGPSPLTSNAAKAYDNLRTPESFVASVGSLYGLPDVERVRELTRGDLGAWGGLLLAVASTRVPAARALRSPYAEGLRKAYVDYVLRSFDNLATAIDRFRKGGLLPLGEETYVSLDRLLGNAKQGIRQGTSASGLDEAIALLEGRSKEANIASQVEALIRMTKKVKVKAGAWFYYPYMDELGFKRIPWL